MKKRGFKMKSGNNPEFKEMGSSPHKFLGGFGQTLKKGFNALTGLGKDGNEAQGAEGAIATDEQKAALESGQGVQLGKDANSKGKLKKIAQILSSDEGRTMDPDLQPSAFGKVTYTEAKAKDSNLDKYIAERKKYKAGSKEYEDLQAKINAAYGTVRSEKMKVSQVKRHKDDKSRTGDQKKKKDISGYVPQTISRKDKGTDYDPVSRKKYEYVPQSQK
tara:strand:+ start:751 stop:1404 length:654 start_codon:yes stop_codon:yes gene_type:complete